jgi:hypothetical protein
MGKAMQTNYFGPRTLCLAALVMLLQGCDPKSSSTGGPGGSVVPTSQMTIDLKVESRDSATAVVRANLNDGRPAGSSYRLDGGDFFRACLNGVCRTMADNDSLSTPDYIARFDYRPGVDYVVSFNRQEGQNAPDSRVVLPPDFTIVTPANHQQVTDGEILVASWSPTGAPARVVVSYEAECTLVSGTAVSSGPLSADSDADGREFVSINSILNAVRSNSTAAITRCSIDVIVSHERSGRIDPAFDGGTALGIVSRTVNLDYVPR